MRLKYKVRDFDGKTVQIQKQIRDEDHFKAQLKYKKIKFRDKTKYTRKGRKQEKYDEL